MEKQSVFKTISSGGALVALCIWVLPAVSVAQQYHDPSILQKTINRKPVEYQSPGIRMGSFFLSPGAELVWESNDNIYYRQNSGTSDSIIHLRRWLNLNSDWGRHELNLNAYADLGMYDEFGSEDYEDWVVSLDGRIDVRRGSAFNYKASYLQLHEDRSSPDDVGGIKPTEFSFSGFDVGYSRTFNRLAAANDVLEGRVISGRVPEKWDGKTAERIVEWLIANA